jgi:predicted MFS family arabinose efflux permease
MFFLTAIFLQGVRGESPLTTGLQLLPMGAAAVLAAIIASRLVTRLGTRPVQLAGTVLSVAGLLLLSRVGAHDSYVGSLLPGLLVFGPGIVGIGVPAQVAAQSEVQSDQAGAASGVVNAAYQVGGTLGLAVITTIANSRVKHLTHVGTPAHAALTSGFQRGLHIAAILAAANLLISLRSPQVIADAEQTAAGAAA